MAPAPAALRRPEDSSPPPEPVPTIGRCAPSWRVVPGFSRVPSIKATQRSEPADHDGARGCDGRAPFDDAFAGAGVEVLTEAECLRLLVTQPIGRIAVSMEALPAVFPVNFCVVDRHVMFRTATGTKLRAALRDTVVAFEVDDFDAGDRSGWSVLVVGRASEVPAEELARLEPLPVRPWAPGVHDHMVRVSLDVVSGRRFAGRAAEGARG